MRREQERIGRIRFDRRGVGIKCEKRLSYDETVARRIPAMGVNHSLLPVTTQELTWILDVPERIREVVDGRRHEVCELLTDGCAIVALTGEGKDDPLSFIRTGGPEGLCGWVGGYKDDPFNCEVDMGYGPASYYRHPFIAIVAEKLSPWTVEFFAENCDVDWLESAPVYPTGWLEPHRKEMLIDSFGKYRECILVAAASGRHLLVWCE
jgi:hypothetical protein